MSGEQHRGQEHEPQHEHGRDSGRPLTEEATAILAMAAHELKNALAGIGVALARCEQRLHSGHAVTSEDLGLARTEVRRLSALVNDLLDGARVDLGEVHIRPATLDLTGLVREVVDLFRAARARSVTLRATEVAVIVHGDADRLRGVLLNYLENAAKYAPPPADIVVSLEPATDPGRVRVAVQDSGPGIQPQDQGRLFERFFRAPTVARRTQGLGLGLYLCRAIAEAHQGSVGVKSTPGAGATFWIELPRAPVPER